MIGMIQCPCCKRRVPSDAALSATMIERGIKKHRVTVTVSGGVAEVTTNPSSVRVKIVDLDNQEAGE